MAKGKTYTLVHRSWARRIGQSGIGPEQPTHEETVTGANAAARRAVQLSRKTDDYVTRNKVEIVDDTGRTMMTCIGPTKDRSYKGRRPSSEVNVRRPFVNCSINHKTFRTALKKRKRK